MIIADTSAIIASIDSDAAEHKDCARLVTESDSTLLVSHMVVAEVDYLLTTRFGVATANRFLSDVASDAYQLAPTDQSDLEQAISINTRYADHELGVTDCINVVLAERHDTLKIFTLAERHFRVVRPLRGESTFAAPRPDHELRTPRRGARLHAVDGHVLPSGRTSVSADRVWHKDQRSK